ncbi:MAG TPA: type I glutamate--ammonia ligase [Polyangia bacterium]|jgi:glutamine synthetase|nr:type I glutamate--ammonia ligase [Polyangia bacterium]
MTPAEVLKYAEKNGAKFVDFKFVDLLGIWQHTTMPIGKLEVDSFKDGFFFDGSSIRGWQPIHASDMIFIPDAASAVMDPFPAIPTLSLICDIVDAITKQPYSRDPRTIAAKAEAYLKTTGIGDTSYFGPEPEFFIFDEVRFSEGPNRSSYLVDSIEGAWNSDRTESPNLGYKPAHKGGYFPVAPTDTLGDLRAEMATVIMGVGIPVEVFHHEVATGGQCELSMKFNTLKTMADWTMWYKYIVKNVARKHGKTATFMPKPIFGDNGSGMHCHQSIWKNEKNLFAGDGYAGLSEMALHYIGGILKHAPAILAITNPGTNSYKRLVPGYEAPVNLAYSSRNRSASVRIPIGTTSPKSKRLEFRCPDPTANPYLAFAAMMMAGVDGIQNKISPGNPLDKDIYALAPEELKDVPKAPGSLDESLKALEKDHAFLLKGDVFTPDVIETWLEYKREHEVDALRLRPHPHEFALYFDN